MVESPEKKNINVTKLRTSCGVIDWIGVTESVHYVVDKIYILRMFEIPNPFWFPRDISS